MVRIRTGSANTRLRNTAACFMNKALWCLIPRRSKGKVPLEPGTSPESLTFINLSYFFHKQAEKQQLHLKLLVEVIILQ